MYGCVRASLLALAVTSALAGAIDPATDLVAFWPGPLEPKSVALLREAGITAVILESPGGEKTEPFVQACRAAGILPLAYLGAPKDIAAAREAAEKARTSGFRGAALEAFGDEVVMRAFLERRDAPENAIVFVKPEQLAWRLAPAQTVLRFGQWPGIRGGGRRGPDLGVASASREPWVDANSYLVSYLRGMWPDRAAWLGYRPDQEGGVSKDNLVPYDSLELAFAEAYASGGNFVLSVPGRYSEALAAGDKDALAAWRSFGETVRFLKTDSATFRRPRAAGIGVAAGTVEQSGEILNMLYRRNASPAVFAATAPQQLDPARFRAVVVGNVPRIPAAAQARFLAYAAAGGLLIAAPGDAKEKPWWAVPAARKVKSDEDRDHYEYGKGRILAYRGPVDDPSEFALDVIDAVGVRTRDVRLWNAGSIVAVLNRLAAGSLALTLVNYGSPRTYEFPARLEGAFRKATLTEPGATAPRALKTAKRGTATEVVVDRVNRIAVILVE